ncbi:hypothetical protein GU926_14905 [Nibribacter ruber]|uniref:Uncharacterized protein n=1 Tax=Nibribacter ruber TaxID=2698458 RepID=A0A6P1P2L2_9BACT|nr:DUF6588 family protein [Nibribacter ruber]QHL88646.1 hypothetical protein GU926_14905 [Nibribacter ruber]
MLKRSLQRLSFWALPALALLLAAPAAHAQEEVGEFIRAGKEDATKLVKAYAEPAGIALGHNLNSGWFNSGKAMGLGRFDVRIYASAVFAPDDAKTFDISKLGLKQIRTSNGSTFDPNKPVMVPTVFGEDKEGPDLTVYTRNPLTNQEEEVVSFNSPPGAGYDVLPFPMAQVSVGLIKDTEIAVRFVPEIKADDFTGSLWGVGVKHGLKQWIPVLASIPGFDITVFGGYTNLSTSYGLDVPLTDDNQMYATAQQKSATYYDGQALELKTKAWTASLVASKTISVITGYAGIRYSNVETDLNAVGKYPVVAYRTTAPYNKYVDDVVDPILVNMKDAQVGGTAGLRLKLAFFSIYGEYTLAKYSTAMAGIGLGWN